MKKYFFTGLLALIVFFAAGCADPHTQIEQDTNVPSIIVDGVMYWLRDTSQSIQIAEEDILGHVSSVVSANLLPQQEGETNCNLPGAPYARWSDEEHPDAVVLYNESQDIWLIFDPWDEGNEYWHASQQP